MANLRILSFLAALCLISTVASAARPITHFIVQGRVYCDTCRAGFETPATTYMSDARVRVECRTRSTGSMTYSIEGVTDKSGTYKIPVNNEHDFEICEAVLVGSSQSGCAVVENGRDRARVVLSHNTGIVSDTRFANSLGFIKDEPMAICAQVLKQYETTED